MVRCFHRGWGNGDGVVGFTSNATHIYTPFKHSVITALVLMVCRKGMAQPCLPLWESCLMEREGCDGRSRGALLVANDRFETQGKYPGLIRVGLMTQKL